MRFSVVTISFNQAQFLEKAIVSVITQDYPDLEYIIVDAGSTDGSQRIIQRYSHRVAKIIFEPDHGPADGLNKGFQIATGQYYAFLNSDDFLLPSAISFVAKYFEVNPNIDVLTGNSFVVDKYDNILRSFYSDKFRLVMAAYGSCKLSQASTFFRRTAFEKTNGFNVLNTIAWDGELFVDIALSGGCFTNVDDFLSAFRVHETSISSTKTLREKYLAYLSYIYEKIKHQKPGSIYKLKRQVAVILRKILNPRDTLERVFYGPISYRNLK